MCKVHKQFLRSNPILTQTLKCKQALLLLSNSIYVWFAEEGDTSEKHHDSTLSSGDDVVSHIPPSAVTKNETRVFPYWSPQNSANFI